jgi:hypothetical protein
MPKAAKPKTIELTITKRVTIVEKQCPVCGNTFEGQTNKKYCGLPCQMKANYARHAEQYRKARMKKYQATKA